MKQNLIIKYFLMIKILKITKNSIFHKNSLDKNINKI